MIFIIALWSLLLNMLNMQSCSTPPPQSKTTFTAPKLSVPPMQGGPTDPLHKSTDFDFIDKTKEIGLGNGQQGTHLYALDLNDDGHDDLIYLPDHFSSPKVLLYSLKDKKFDFHPRPHSLFPSGLKASFFIFDDFDRDQIMDAIAVTFHKKGGFKQPALIYFSGKKNLITNFLEFEEKKEIFSAHDHSPISTVIPIDDDLDGDLDLFVGHWLDSEGLSGSRSYGRTFTNLLKEKKSLSFQQTPFVTDDSPSPTWGATACDLDLNGITDLIISNSFGFPNHVLLGEQKHTPNSSLRIEWHDYAKNYNLDQDTEGNLLLQGGGNSTFSLCFDFNRDEKMDLFTGEIHFNYDDLNRDRSSLLTSIPAPHPLSTTLNYLRTPLESATAASGQADRQGLVLDYDLDGRFDILVENSGIPPHSRLLLYQQQDKDFSFQERAALAGVDILNPSGCIVVDFNDDGLADILCGQTQIRAPSLTPQIYYFENQNKSLLKNALKITLKPKSSVSMGTGSLMRLTYGQGSEKIKQFIPIQRYHGGQPSLSTASYFVANKFEKKNLNTIEITWTGNQGPKKRKEQKAQKVNYKNQNEILIEEKF